MHRDAAVAVMYPFMSSPLMGSQHMASRVNRLSVPITVMPVPGPACRQYDRFHRVGFTSSEEKPFDHMACRHGAASQGGEELVHGVESNQPGDIQVVQRRIQAPQFLLKMSLPRSMLTCLVWRLNHWRTFARADAVLT